APSRHEPLGNMVLDAWVHGVPMVASNTGGMAGLIEDGVSGLLVSPERATKLAAAVTRVLTDKQLAKQLAAGGRQAFDAKFSEAQVVAAYVNYYAKIAKRSGGHD
ncbi:MAG: glycosyltransferase, partial [Proteobacteria bacterium]|nr:glycosyltransferase [Pseudomonadota bacterium]